MCVYVWESSYLHFGHHVLFFFVEYLLVVKCVMTQLSVFCQFQLLSPSRYNHYVFTLMEHCHGLCTLPMSIYWFQLGFVEEISLALIVHFWTSAFFSELVESRFHKSAFIGFVEHGKSFVVFPYWMVWAHSVVAAWTHVAPKTFLVILALLLLELLELCFDELNYFVQVGDFRGVSFVGFP